MDAVPKLFVDAVIRAFGKPGLDAIAKVADPMWSSAGKLGIQSRRYFNLYIGKVDGKFALGFREIDLYTEGLPSVRTIRPWEIKLIKQEDFRIRYVLGLIGDLRGFATKDCQSADLLLVDEKAFLTTLSQLARQVDWILQWGELELRQNYPKYDPITVNLGDEDFAQVSRMVLKSFCNRANFPSTTIPYVGSESEGFLKACIYNNPRVHSIKLEKNWPSSILPDIQHFLRKREGRYVRMPDNFRVESDFLTQLVDFWRNNGDLECELYYEGSAKEPPQELMMNKVPNFEAYFYRKHDSKKSISFYDARKDRISFGFLKCSCGVSDGRCPWNTYPDLHKL
ncbi:hypothetical protein QR680_014896 [Steinernema hermaphroditum]|uniref:Uncharacterized protein n=1 Tax=Steinernema hermaphroditum TaxID=289476 RepID=A0AA39M512_9BILA|nr:hypothetical protein QR680_014896 [Steinernema hermaphroditum]